MYLKYLKKQEVSGKPIVDKIGKLNKFYLPLSEWIYSVYSKDFETKIIDDEKVMINNQYIGGYADLEKWIAFNMPDEDF